MLGPLISETTKRTLLIAPFASWEAAEPQARLRFGAARRLGAALAAGERDLERRPGGVDGPTANTGSGTSGQRS